MTGLGLLFTLALAGLFFVLPRRWGSLPLLIGAAYMPSGLEVEVGPAHFSVIRILIIVGFVRVMSKGERIAGRLNFLDKLMVLWGIWFVCSSVFHVSSVLVTRLGVVFDILGAYFLFRVLLKETEDIRNLFKIACILFVPLAAEMILERLAGKNYFALLGGTSEAVLVRHGKFRAKGPFGHAILAGTVGAMCLPMAVYLWRQERKLALVGLAATGGMILASASSGPIMTALSILGAMALWKIRGRLRAIRWLAVFLIIALDLVMSDPVYFLIARIDLAGGSTGWYRAQLIRSAIEHLNEWWLAGTDVTRHWMHVHIGESNTDITNYYIQMGVWGGLPLMLVFMAVLVAGFAAVGRALRMNRKAPFEHRFMIWTLGSILFGHATTFFSVSYFDQSVIFLCLILAIIGSLRATKPVSVVKPTPSPVTNENAAWVSSKDESNLCHNC